MKWYLVRCLRILIATMAIYLFICISPARAEEAVPAVPNTVCQDIYGNPYCSFLSIAMQTIGMGPTTPMPTATLTRTPTITPTPMKTPIPTPTRTPAPGDVYETVLLSGNEISTDPMCGPVPCKRVKFVGSACTPSGVGYNNEKSTFNGTPFNQMTFNPIDKVSRSGNDNVVLLDPTAANQIGDDASNLKIVFRCIKQ